MHSSSMRTVSSLTLPHSIWQGVYLSGGVPARGMDMSGGYLMGGVPAWGGGCTCPEGTYPGGVPAQRVPAQGGLPAQVLPL